MMFDSEDRWMHYVIGDLGLTFHPKTFTQRQRWKEHVLIRNWLKHGCVICDGAPGEKCEVNEIVGPGFIVARREDQNPGLLWAHSFCILEQMFAKKPFPFPESTLLSSFDALRRCHHPWQLRSECKYRHK